MQQLTDDLATILPAAFDSEEYQAQQKALEEALKEKQTQAMESLKNVALSRRIALIRTPTGFAFAPLHDGEVLKPEEYVRLSKDEQESIEREIQALQDALQDIMDQVPHWQRETKARLTDLNQEVARHATPSSTPSVPISDRPRGRGLRVLPC